MRGNCRLGTTVYSEKWFFWHQYLLFTKPFKINLSYAEVHEVFVECWFDLIYTECVGPRDEVLVLDLALGFLYF